MKAIFSILLDSGIILTVTGTFAGNSAGFGTVTFHPKLAKWFDRAVYSYNELAVLVAAAAYELHGGLSVMRLPA